MASDTEVGRAQFAAMPGMNDRQIVVATWPKLDMRLLRYFAKLGKFELIQGIPQKKGLAGN